MKKALSLLIAAVLVMGWSSQSFAADHYVSGNIGLAWFSDDTATPVESDEDKTVDFTFDSGIALTAAIGCDYGSTRLEAELGYQKNDLSSIAFYDDGDDFGPEEGVGNVSMTTFMLNGYYDIQPMDNSNIELFLTAGVGAAFVHFDEAGPGLDYSDGVFVADDYTSTFSETTWAFQLGAGVAIPVGDDLVLDARYRYFNAADITSRDDDELTADDPMNINLDSHSGLIGLRYNF